MRVHRRRRLPAGRLRPAPGRAGSGTSGCIAAGCADRTARRPPVRRAHRPAGSARCRCQAGSRRAAPRGDTPKPDDSTVRSRIDPPSIPETETSHGDSHPFVVIRPSMTVRFADNHRILCWPSQQELQRRAARLPSANELAACVGVQLIRPSLRLMADGRDYRRGGGVCRHPDAGTGRDVSRLRRPILGGRRDGAARLLPGWGPNGGGRWWPPRQGDSHVGAEPVRQERREPVRPDADRVRLPAAGIFPAGPSGAGIPAAAARRGARCGPGVAPGSDGWQHGGLQAPVPGGPGTLVTIGDIAVTGETIMTPSGPLPLHGAVWTVSDMAAPRSGCPRTPSCSR